jgi:serine/threonine protein kinase
MRNAESGSAYKNMELTRTGARMGTASYMSPEQVRGERLDARSDLFSLGLVLYEMATGQRAFPGGTVAAVHDSILSRTPPPARDVNPGVAPWLEAIIEQALQKDRNRRYQTAAELGDDLRRMLARPSATPGKVRVTVVCVAVAIALAAGAGFWWAKRQPTSMTEMKQRQMTHNSSDRPVGTATISPDGRSLAYSDMKGIHLLTVDTGEVRNVPLPEGFDSAEKAAWSVGPWLPNGTKFLVHTRRVGQDPKAWSSEGSSIWSVSMPGVAPPRKIRDHAQTWTISSDGSSMTFDTRNGRFGDREIWVSDTSGESARKLFETDEESSISGMEWSPHGQRVIYAKEDKSGAAILTRDLKGGAPRVLMSFPGTLRDYHWMPDGRIWYSVAELAPTDRPAIFGRSESRNARAR